jgi:hypothetical protein
MQSRSMEVAAAGALTMCMSISTAIATSVTQRGELVGLPSGPTSCLGITIPVVTSSTPWTFLGGRVQFFSVTPVIETGVQNTSYNASVYNPALFGQLARDLGNGFGFSYSAATRISSMSDGDKVIRQMGVWSGGARCPSMPPTTRLGFGSGPRQSGRVADTTAQA